MKTPRDLAEHIFGISNSDEAYDNSLGIIAEIQRLIHEAIEEAKPRWIPCAERLPEEGQEVLIYSRHDWVIVDTYNGPHEPWETSVTHWMNLPEPPK